MINLESLIQRIHDRANELCNSSLPLERTEGFKLLVDVAKLTQKEEHFELTKKKKQKSQSQSRTEALIPLFLHFLEDYCYYKEMDFEALNGIESYSQANPNDIYFTNFMNLRSGFNVYLYSVNQPEISANRLTRLVTAACLKRGQLFKQRGLFSYKLNYDKIEKLHEKLNQELGE
jgi:hypothetical protein